MHPLTEIVVIIETNAKQKYGSINKMFADNDLSKSIIVNMKRENPSIPNIETFSKIAEVLELSTDYLLLGKPIECDTKDISNVTFSRAAEIINSVLLEYQIELIGIMRKDAETLKDKIRKK